MLTEQDIQTASRIEMLSRSLTYCKQDFRQVDMEEFKQLDPEFMAKGISNSVCRINDRVTDWGGFRDVLIETMDTLNKIMAGIIEAKERELERLINGLKQPELITEEQ